METVIERIEKGHFWKFHGGIHPPQQKFISNDKPIRQLPLPELLRIPVQQHIGEPGDIIVNIGDKVLKGQVLTNCSHPMVVPVHAPTSGTITSIEESIIAHPSGLKELCIFLTPDGEDKWRERQICQDFSKQSKEDLIQKIAQAGISGMGGAGFPSHIKLNTAAQINYLIINAAECEPYITSDDLLMREQSAAIVDGIKILNQILAPAFILIGIEDNKPEAIQALKNATKDLDIVKVCVIPTIYPTGGEKQLIQVLTGNEVPSGQLPSSLGIVMHNVGTCYAIADAVINDIPLIKRVVTVSGMAVEKPQNVWALIGTPVQFLLEHCGNKQGNKKHIIMGGPMMGFSLPSFNVPVVKTTNCVLSPSEREIPNDNKEVECIRCGQCVDACPSQLLPQELQWSAKAKDQQSLKDLNLFDCIECGACAYVCPSHIPLVHYYRVAKAEIRQQQLLDIKAEKAKQRFEARKARLEREKIAREEKHKKAAEARKARMNSGTPDANKEKSAVAAALARVKAKKAAEQAKATGDTINNEESQITIDAETSDKKSQVAAAIARAKAKKQAQANENKQKTDKIKASVNSNDSKEAKIAAAVAKAKAKQQANEKSASRSSSEQADIEQLSKTKLKTTPVSSGNAEQDKKAKIAAAIAKAKARKQQTKVSNTDNETIADEVPDAPVIEKADIETNDKDKSQPATDKKARIAAAIAKAKAKKQLESKQ